GAQQGSLGVGEPPLQAGYVADADPDAAQSEMVADLEENALGLAIMVQGALPITALLVDDSQVEQRSAALREPAQPAVALQRPAQMLQGDIPFAQVLVDQAEVVAHPGRADLV